VSPSIFPPQHSPLVSLVSPGQRRALARSSEPTVALASDDVGERVVCDERDDGDAHAGAALRGHAGHTPTVVQVRIDLGSGNKFYVSREWGAAPAAALLAHRRDTRTVVPHASTTGAPRGCRAGGLGAAARPAFYGLAEVLAARTVDVGGCDGGAASLAASHVAAALGGTRDSRGLGAVLAVATAVSRADMYAGWGGDFGRSVGGPRKSKPEARHSRIILAWHFLW